MEKHYVHVAEGIEFAATITAERHHGEWSGGGALVLLGKLRCRREDVTQHHIDQLDPKRANLPASSSGLMAQAQPVFLDFQELLVKREGFRRLFRARGGKLALRVGQHFFEMTGNGHCGDVNCYIVKALHRKNAHGTRGSQVHRNASTLQRFNVRHQSSIAYRFILL